MSISRGVVAGVLAAWSVFAASNVSGDAARGERLLQTEGCVYCHRASGGHGSAAASDLTRRFGRNYTPASMASVIWNHAPEFRPAINAETETQPASRAADLFAYFVFARYFESPGDAGRGKRAFAERHCADCHGSAVTKGASASPVSAWESAADPIALAQQMWNHGPAMKEAFTGRKLRWSKLTAQELTDIVVWVKSVRRSFEARPNFTLVAPGGGNTVFESKGCAGCHRGKLSLENRLRSQNLTDIAVDMWNHEPYMQAVPPTLSLQEMRELIGTIWAPGYFRGEGSAKRGEAVFHKNQCAYCHEDPSSEAPRLARGRDEHSNITIISGVWPGGQRMMDLMSRRTGVWPRFTARQISDLIAYLNSQPAPGAAPANSR